MPFNSRTGKAALCKRGGLETARIFRQLGYPNLAKGTRNFMRNSRIRKLARLEAQLEKTRAELAALPS